MKITKIASILLMTFSLCGAFAADPYPNPFWKNGVEYTQLKNYNRYLIARPTVITGFSLPVDYADGIYFGAFYQLNAELRLSKMFNFDANIKFGPNIPSLRSLSTSWISYPVYFIKTYLNYRFRNFFNDGIAENDILTGISFLFDFPKMPRWLDIEMMNGICLKFIDFNIYDPGTVYRNDWFLEVFVLWQFKMMFHPAFVYSVGFSLGNYDDHEVYTMDYWQFVLYNYFHLPMGFSIFLNGGFSYAGSLPFAGNINRGWGEIGLRYEIGL